MTTEDMNTFGDTVLSYGTSGDPESAAGKNYRKHVLVCMNRIENGCLNKGAFDVKTRLYRYKSDQKLEDVKVSSVQNLEHCDEGPTLVVYPDNVWYKSVSPEDVPRIVDEHLIDGEPVEDLKFDPNLPEDHQHFIVCTFLANCGPEGGGKAFRYFMKQAQNREDVSVVQSHGCLKECSMGPIGCVYPEGNWYGGLAEYKYDDIWTAHIEKCEDSKYQTGKLGERDNL
ncbi:(2Fe-2S) ferredoxin domain-containing protein [Haladaptatus sp. NG-SE-30]